MKKTIAACVIILLTLPQIISAQYKLSIGNFWITNFESYIEKLEITDTVTLFDSLFYYELDQVFLSKNSQIIYKETSDTVNGTFIRKLPNGLFEKVTYKNGERFGFENYYEYKDNPQLHERWLHIIFESDTFWAVAKSIFDGLVFGEIRKVIEVRYSTGLQDYNRYFCDELGAELSETSADGMEVTSYLLGCFVDGIVYGDTSFKPVGIEEPNKLNLKYELYQNYPNPFNLIQVQQLVIKLLKKLM